MLINSASVTVLLDSGATVSAMNEATFRRYGLAGKVKIKKLGCQIKPYGAVNETNLIPVLGSFGVLTAYEGDHVIAHKGRYTDHTVAEL